MDEVVVLLLVYEVAGMRADHEICTTSSHKDQTIYDWVSLAKERIGVTTIYINGRVHRQFIDGHEVA